MLLRDVMKQSGLSKKAVQYYEDQGFIHPDKLENGYRDYDKDCLETLCTIRSLRQMGLRMKEIRAILIDQEYAPQVYEQLIHEMDAQIVRLQDQRTMLRKHMKQEPAEILPAAVNRPYVY
ncbi:MAG: MerR family transcriptional regulator, partial [Clostridium sp.]|nr:MerR family transcriptional regulator [Clostridium sp.]